MSIALVNGTILSADAPAGRGTVLLENGLIRGVSAAESVPAGAEQIDLGGGLLVPGFIDVQVNGGGGMLFNEKPDCEALRVIAHAHARYGTTGLLPTVVSGDLPLIAEAIRAVEEAIASGVPGILGIHIEGPFLNAARSGIHDPASFRTIDDDAVALLSSLKRGKTLVTLAPERADPRIVRKLTAAGVIVSAGHTDARYEEIQPALAAGMRGFTHLFNAMSPFQTRRPGAVGAALDDSASWCGIIADGRHVHPAALRIALRCKGPDKLMLVTDAMPSVGHAKVPFTLHGKTITVSEGVCLGPDGTLAGSDLDMATGFRNLLLFLKIDEAAASRIASANPAAFLGLEKEMGRIGPGRRADLVWLDQDLRVRQTWIGGVPQIRVP